MSFWEFMASMATGIAIALFLTYFKKKEGVSEPGILFFLKIGFLGLLVMSVIGFTTRHFFEAKDERDIARFLIWSALSIILYLGIRRLPNE